MGKQGWTNDACGSRIAPGSLSLQSRFSGLDWAIALHSKLRDALNKEWWQSD